MPKTMAPMNVELASAGSHIGRFNPLIKKGLPAPLPEQALGSPVILAWPRSTCYYAQHDQATRWRRTHGVVGTGELPLVGAGGARCTVWEAMSRFSGLSLSGWKARSAEILRRDPSVPAGPQSGHLSGTVTNTHLLEGLRSSGNRTVWRQFVERYRPMIVGYACRSFGFSASDAEDAAQATLTAFVQAYQQGRYDRDKGRLRKWMFGIAVRQLRNLARKRGRVREVQIVDESDGTGLIPRVPDERSLEDAWEQEWRRAVLRQCMEEVRFQFDKTTVGAFELYAWKGWPVGQVAEHLGMTENAVYLAKKRILKRIRELLPRMEENW